jgi:hypothetical protein
MTQPPEDEAENEADREDLTFLDGTDIRRVRKDPDRVPMYFEFPLDKQLEVEPIHGEEVNVAVDINGGRDLLLSPFREDDEDRPPTVDPHVSFSRASGCQFVQPESYCDSIANILQAAVQGDGTPRISADAPSSFRPESGWRAR